MPVLMPSDTAKALSDGAFRCDSRSLLLDRFVFDNPAMNEARKLHFAQVCDGFFQVIEKTRSQWLGVCESERAKEADRRTAESFLRDTQGMGQRTQAVQARREACPSSDLGFADFPGSKILHAQLQARLVVNMAGGVMENAGLSLDRYGLPLIPGSAVKGCARHAALAALREWTEAGEKPAGDANLLAPACEPFSTRAEMLAAIARVFGWVKSDWGSDKHLDKKSKKEKTWKSDFVWACDGDESILLVARRQVGDWESASGTVSFLPSRPCSFGRIGKIEGLPLPVPEPGKLELDVVTCHHRDYYDEKMEEADDIEEPVPVVFPAVAPGHVFAFALLPLRGAQPKSVASAQTWLRVGLEAFGLGGKTNAGYGWFAAGESVGTAVAGEQERQRESARKLRRQQEEEARRRFEEQERARKKAEDDAATADMSDEEKADWTIRQLSPDQFEARLRAFHKEKRKGGPADDEKAAIIRALRGERLSAWTEFKAKAVKGDLATAANAIRVLNKQLNGDKMP